MGITKIEWCDYTFNHVRGCSKVSPGCEHCYAAAQSLRNPSTLGRWGPMGTRVVAAESAWRQPLKWNEKAKAAGERHRVFCASMADVFEDWDGPMLNAKDESLFKSSVVNDWLSLESVEGIKPSNLAKLTPLTMSDVRRRLFSLIDATPNLDWLILTKRPENIVEMMPKPTFDHAGWNGTLAGYWHQIGKPRPNVWLGVSVENQEQADKRIPILLQTPAAVRFLSCEPLLGPVDLLRVDAAGFGGPAGHKIDCIRKGYWSDGPLGFVNHSDMHANFGDLHWVIVGGESGHGARPMHPDWAASILEQCQAAGVAYFFKQWGEWLPYSQWRKDLLREPLGPQTIASCLVPRTALNGTTQGVVSAYRVGKQKAGRLLNGREWSEFPK